jgi:hypothetical protein
MKLNLKEALIRFNILQEGWMEDLSGKYSEDTLILVGRMLQQAFPNEDITNHPLAEWIAKAAQGLGKFPWEEPHKTRNEQAFQEILSFVRDNENAEEIVNSIKSKKAVEALNYVKAERKKQEEEITGEEELREWLDQGLFKIIGRGPKGSFWVQPLKGEFFGVAQCGKGSGSQGEGEFGIGCQRGATGGGGAVGFGRDRGRGQTYSLLAKSRNGHYTTIISTGADPKTKEFLYHSLQFGNKVIGSESWGDWSKEDFMNAFVDFMANNPYGRNMYKEGFASTTVDENGEVISTMNTLPSRLREIARNRPIFYKLLRNHPDFVKYYQIALRNTLGEEEFALFTVGARELYEQNPERFMQNLSTYLQTEKEEALSILGEINFEDFIRRYGEESIVNNIDKILSVMSYAKFQELIKPFINYNNFLNRSSKENIKEVIRQFSEKANSSKKTLPIINDIIGSDEDFNTIMNKFGNGDITRGIMSFLASLSTPRESKHQNYTKTSREEDGITAITQVKARDANRNLIDSQGRVIMSDGVVYDVNGRPMHFQTEEEKSQYLDSRTHFVDKEVPVSPQFWILRYEEIRKLLKQNKDKIVNALGGDIRAKVKWLEYYLYNSSAQDREKELKKEKDSYMEYYNKLYDKGESELPGILQLAKILAPQKNIEQDGKKTRVNTAMKQMSPIIADNFEGLSRYVYEIPKEDYKNSIKHLNNFYYKNSKSDSKLKKIVDSYSATIQTLLVSKVSIPEILENAQKILDLLNSKNVNAETLVGFLYNIVNIMPSSTTLKKFVMKNLSENEIGKKIEQARIGRNPRTGVTKPNLFVIQKVQDIMKIMEDIKEDEGLEEQKVRNYIKNLLESRYGLKKKVH